MGLEILNTKIAISEKVQSLKRKGISIGLVPTMGALHEGHLSLVRNAQQETDAVIVSIFINPTQFNDPDDLKNYPRHIENDFELLRAHDVDMIFAPEVLEMYPEPEGDQRQFDLHPLDSVMEGKYRKGHFNGVAQIVSKLFESINPDRAYFGQKDFQQLVIIKRLVAIMGYNITIVPCPIIREPDGLAMSSRNQLLTEKERQLAPMISKILFRAKELMNEYTPGELIKWVSAEISEEPTFSLEYFDIVDDRELNPVENWSDPTNKVGCIAVYLGGIRLFDNVVF